MRCCHSTHGLLFRTSARVTRGGSAPVFDPNPPRPFARPRLLRAVGFSVSQHGQLGAIPPPPFLSVSPLESMRSGGAIPPPQKGYLSDTGAIPYENNCQAKWVRYPPLRYYLERVLQAIWGGISHWAAKCPTFLSVKKFLLFLSCHLCDLVRAAFKTD